MKLYFVQGNQTQAGFGFLNIYLYVIGVLC